MEAVVAEEEVVAEGEVHGKVARVARVVGVQVAGVVQNRVPVAKVPLDIQGEVTELEVMAILGGLGHPVAGPTKEDAGSITLVTTTTDTIDVGTEVRDRVILMSQVSSEITSFL